MLLKGRYIFPKIFVIGGIQKCTKCVKMKVKPVKGIVKKKWWVERQLQINRNEMSGFERDK